MWPAFITHKNIIFKLLFISIMKQILYLSFFYEYIDFIYYVLPLRMHIRRNKTK